MRFQRAGSQMSTGTRSATSILLWPFTALWALLSLILGAIGRILCALLGLAVMAAGVALSLTVIGAIIGIPFVAFGALLMVRALF
jgi:hypothetical protein